MERIFSNKQSVVKAANFMILRKVVDKMQINSETFYKELGIKKDVVDRIVRGEYGAGKKWKSKAVADKMKIDDKIFTGNYLIKIEGKAIEEIQQNFEKYVHDNEDAPKVNKSKLLSKKNEYATEYALWKAILEYGSSKKEDEFHKAKVLLLNEIGKQVEEEDFKDLELMKFWNYFRKLKEKMNFSQKE